MIRSPWHRTAGWSPEEAAAELHDRRAELVAQLRRRSEARGVPVAAQEEIVDDAITAVVMAPRGTSNEQHLLGAFWLAVSHRCRRYREGRPFTRLGSRQRVEFDTAVEHLPTAAESPLDTLELRDRFARAADLMADLDARERQIVSVMATYGVGPVPAARHLGLKLGEVRSAVRSANAKLDRVAAIAAAGRMCHYRYGAITAHAAGEASATEATAARAHVRACIPCERVYRKLCHEMRGCEFQRAAAAAFLPVPAPLVHVGGLSRLAAWFEQHTPSMPHGGGERAAEVLGGAGVAKVATAGAVIVAAGGALTGHIVHAIQGAHAPAHHRADHIVRQASQSYQPASFARAWVDPTATTIPASPHPARRSTAASSRHVAPHHSLPSPPSKSLGYLALGGSSGSTSPPSSPSSSTSSSPARAVVASVDQYPRASSSSPSAREASSSPGEASPPPTSSRQSGGGANLGYLGQ